MAGNTRGQTSLRDQANPSQQTPSPQADNTAISAFSTQMTQMNAQMNAHMAQMTAMMNAMSTRMEVLEARSRSPTPTPQTTTPQPTASHTTPQATQPATQGEDKRWRPEEVGYFDGTGDVIAFTDRLYSTASQKGVKLVQGNLVSVLQATAFNWYHYELDKDTKGIYNLNTRIDPWCEALIKRFGPTHSQLMTQLEACQYTRKDAAEKKDATAYIQDVMRITKGLNWAQKDGLMTAFHHFEAGLQRDLDPPEQGDLTEFIKQVQLRQSAWYSVYSSFGKSRPPDPHPPPRQSRPYQPYQQYRQQPPQQQYRPPQQPPQQYDRQPRPPAYPPNPKPAVYWANQEEDDWEYDPPSDSYHAYPSFQPPGHTPRRYGNTHDGGGTEAMANWASAGEDHRCNHEGCTHYH